MIKILTIIILGNQLFNPQLYFKQINRYDFFLCEDYGLCSYVKHHKLKLLHVLSSMRLYRDELKSLGLKVHYNSIEDENFYEDYLKKLKKTLSKNKYKKLFFFEIEDKFFEKKLLTINKEVEIEVIKSPMFLFGRNEFNEAIKKNKKPMMANFYKYSRMLYLYYFLPNISHKKAFFSKNAFLFSHSHNA